MRKSLLTNKKGDATDPMIILVILAFLAVSFIVAIFINSKLALVVSNTALNDSSSAPAINSAFNTLNVSSVQQGFIVVFGVMIVFVIASSFLVRVHPVFLFIYIFVLIATLVASAFVGNFYAKLQENAELGAIMETQPMINIIMNNIVLVTMAIGALSMIIVFSKLSNLNIGTGDMG